MIRFKRNVLDNGLTVIAHEDFSTPMVAVNLLYQVGSKNDPANKTGLAHLLEHMMFTGSQNVSDFDTPLQLASGENNAFTNKDITNYYEVLPASNVKTALWLESDRMQDLLLGEIAFKTQQSVVVEEFKETCLNQPYGMVWHQMLALAYKKHPYRWPTIGIDEDHIRSISLENLKSFYDQYYTPNNAILSIGGNIPSSEVFELANEWFSDMKFQEMEEINLPVEPEQTSFRYSQFNVNAPVDMIYLAFHMPARNDPAYYAADFLSDVLGNGKSSRLYNQLVKEKGLFTSIDAFITGNIDPGLFVIEGKLSKNTTHKDAQDAIWQIIEKLKSELITALENQKIYNQMISAVAFGNISLLNNVMNLGYYQYLGDAELINSEADLYAKVTPDDIRDIAKEILQKKNCCQLDVIAN